MLDKHYLTPLFAPSSIVVLAGRADAPETLTPQAAALHAALRAQRYSGTLAFLDLQNTSGTLQDLKQTRADLAVIALPPAEQAAALEVAGHLHCRAALIVSSGIEAQQAAQLQRIARREGIHLLGPNSLGIQRPSLQLNASTAGALAREGTMALVSQSGALTAATLDWANGNGVGFSSVVSFGPHASIGLTEALDFLANDPHTHSIAVCMEGICNARRFMSALRSAAYSKPVVVLKSGRRTAGSAAALTHSATIVGSDDVFDAALRRAGAVRVHSFVELFSATKCLASRYRPVGRRLAVITNGGGPGVLAADAANDIGLELGVLSEAGRAALAPQLPAQATLQELFDLSEDATPAQYRAAIDAALAERQIAGVLTLFSPKPGNDASAVAQALADAKRQAEKPLLSCWLGDATVGEAREVLRDASIPTFRTPEAAVGAFGNIANYHQNQQLLQQTPPSLANSLAQPDIEGARLVIEGVLAERRSVLTEMESKTLLAAFHIPVTRTLLARSANEAMMIATQLGFPVALKIDSPDITHKSDVGGVMLNVQNATAARDAYEAMVQRVARAAPNARIHGVTVQPMARATRGREVCIGLVRDDPFGPVITFGAGGTMIELIGDRAMELPPLNQFLARRLIERSRVAQTLGEWRGANAVDHAALEQVLLRVSEMACALPQLREMDINPLIVDEHGTVAVDARIVVTEIGQTTGTGHHGSYGHLAIMPYPERLEQTWPLRGGGEYLVRPIHPSDAQMIQRLVRELSPESRYMRFASRIAELPPSLLARFTLIDYDRDMALVAVHRERTTGEDGEVRTTERIVGVSRYAINPDPSSCEFALLVADDFASQGLGARLMYSIMDVARERGLAEIQGLVLVENAKMLKLMRRLGFDVRAYPEEPEFKLVVHAL
ncbi:MAG: GNAT family N-acetyltransferase [Comamonadaceae bacterium SCN 68-20]|jgi:acetyltransferase|nr:MAG: GNAT family N-acetyltransferase [Comamonadaceae bacterium SCN 68-20]OJX07710.1 MAG: GNAT family N-acetyltransferase [Burkholderiales bacterium 68-20]UJB65479.1 bifunctional acetate--CoA ligase family protein/GNAT family N-acetyltransferase [Acidovorax sp. YS12]